MSARELITEHLDLWTGAVTTKSTAGRGNSSGRRGKIELTGIKKLRELILELAVRGKLVEQDPDDEPASVLLERIAEEKARLVKEGKIKKPKKFTEITEEEKPFELPTGWSWARLGSIGQIIGGGTPKSGEPRFWAEKGVTWLTPADLYGLKEKYIGSGKRDISRTGLEKSSAQLLPKGSILFSSRAPIGYVAIAKKDLATNQGFKSCSPYISELNQFIYYFLKRSAKHIDESASGTTFKEVSGSKVASISMPLPPLEEQDRIVGKVDELMALCDRLEQQVGDQLEAHEVLVDTLLDALTRSADATEVADNWARIAEHFNTLFTTEASIDKLKQAILQLAVMGRLVEQDEREESAQILLDKIAFRTTAANTKRQKTLDPISDGEIPYCIPRKWKWARLGEISRIVGGFSFKSSDYSQSGMRVIRISDFDEKGFKSESIVRHAYADSLADFRLQPESILMAMTGGTVGKSYLVKSLPEPMMVNQRVACIKIVPEVKSEYVHTLLKTDVVRDIIEEAKNSTNDNISMKDIKNFLVPIPPCEEQSRIIEKVDELMALCDHLKAHLDEADETRTQLAEAVVEQAVST